MFFGIPHLVVVSEMANSLDAKLALINSFLGGSINELLKYPNVKLYFESNAEAHMEGKARKPCIVYIIGDSVLICRPRKYGKKFYVKYQFPVNRIHVDDRLPNEKWNESSSLGSPIVLSHHNRTNALVYYYIWFYLG